MSDEPSEAQTPDEGKVVDLVDNSNPIMREQVAALAAQLGAVGQRVDRVPALAVVSVEVALDAAAAINDGTPVADAKAAAVTAVTQAISGTPTPEPEPEPAPEP